MVTDGWRGVAFDWNRARAFLVTAEEGSLSAAARALGLTQPTVGRQVTALEQELEVDLFQRVGNQLVLTETGLKILESLRAMAEAANRMSLLAAGQTLGLSGSVRVAASQAVSGYLLPEAVSGLRESFPELHIEVVVSNASSDLRRREADIAVRHFEPQDQELFAERIVETSRAWMYATPGYVASIGDPKTQDELSERGELLGFDDVAQMRSFLARIGYGFTEDSFPIRADDHLVQWEMAKRGMGICMMMEEVGDQEPSLVKVLPELGAPVTLPIWLVSHKELKTSRKVQVVFEALKRVLRARAHA